jgi:hypothetical protein
MSIAAQVTPFAGSPSMAAKMSARAHCRFVIQRTVKANPMIRRTLDEAHARVGNRCDSSNMVMRFEGLDREIQSASSTRSPERQLFEKMINAGGT